MPSPVRRLRLRRPDRCVACERELEVGDTAVWDSRARTTTCLRCAEAPLADASAAGASAHARYETQRRNREAAIRKRYGAVGVAVSRLQKQPQHTAAWAQGASGERRVASRLAELLDGDKVEHLHDRRIRGSRANIDHIIVAASGVTVVDAKNVSGQVQVLTKRGRRARRGERLRVGRWDRTAMVDGVLRQLDVVTFELAHAGLGDVPVEGWLCWVQGDKLPGIRTRWVGSVGIDGPRGLARRIRRDGPLTREDAERVADVLRAALPPN